MFAFSPCISMRTFTHYHAQNRAKADGNVIRIAGFWSLSTGHKILWSKQRGRGNYQTKFHGNPSNSCLDYSLKTTNVNLKSLNMAHKEQPYP